MTENVESDLAQNGERDKCPDWWRSVTPSELRASSSVVMTFLEQEGVASSEECEAFARALALQQLLVDKEAVWRTADRALAFRPSIPQFQITHEVHLAAEAWLQRGKLIAKGLSRCLELLQPLDQSEWSASLCRFQISLHLIELSCVAPEIRATFQSAVAASAPVKVGPTKV